MIEKVHGGVVVRLPDTVRHHGVHIPPKMIVRTMRRQYVPWHSAEWIEYIPPVRA